MLRGRVAVVTGAGRGLGREIAVGLARCGMRVALTGRTMSDLETTARRIDREQGSAVVVPADVSVPDRVAALREAVEAELGPAAVLVNAAGVFGPLAPISEVDVHEWIATQEVNLTGPFLTCREFVPPMLGDGWGRIVNVSSASALHEPEPLVSAYSTSKAALNRFTRHLAVELAGTGVTANAIHPGDLKTDMWDDIRRKVSSLGERASDHQAWVRLVEETGGDSPSAAVALVIRIITAPSGLNGSFEWPEGGLQDPIPSW